ncbi:hypothetical protein GALL_433050 [mine drainage metagenome]|uniref:Uncharacterized protein n=1 Tax=mine drainage metagenome TaxID=410659 RepID=A0A1J5Q567_9ZZZZ
MKRIEHALEVLIFGSRWLLAPFYLGLVLGIGLLLVKFIKTFVAAVPVVFSGSGGEAMLAILSLVDIALVANLLIIIIFAGYENFVSKIDTAGHEDRPGWMGHVTFSDLKLKLIGSIVAISGIELLKYFVNVREASRDDMLWAIIIHVTLVFSGVMFALMDKLSGIKADSH